jgi:hypothetical protein
MTEVENNHLVGPHGYGRDFQVRSVGAQSMIVTPTCQCWRNKLTVAKCEPIMGTLTGRFINSLLQRVSLPDAP